MQIFILLFVTVIVVPLIARLIVDPNGNLFYQYVTYSKPIFLRVPSKPGSVSYVEQPKKDQFRWNVKSRLVEISLYDVDSKKLSWVPISTIKMRYKQEGSIDLLPGLPAGLYINDYYAQDFNLG